MDPQIQYAKTSDGVNIAFYALGQGPPIVAMPVIPFNHIQLQWQQDRVVAEAAAERFTYVKYDPRGAGSSTRDVTDFSLEAMVTDLEAVVDRLSLERMALVGIAASGPVAISFAARHPEKVSRLILFSSFASDAYASPKGRAMFAMTEQDWEISTETATQIMTGWSGERALKMASFYRECVTQEVARATVKALANYDVTALLPGLNVPTLVVCQADSVWPQVSDSRYLAAHIPGARMVVAEHEGGDTTAAFAAIGQFINEGAEPAHSEQQPALPEDAAQTQISSPPETKTFASGRYVVVRLLGQGTQKSVYLVDDTVLGRQCALSMLNPTLLDQQDKERIKQEAQTMAQFGAQSNIVTVYDYGEEDGAPFIVCEYVPGGELRDELAAAAGPLALERALAVGTDICRALSFAHGRDVIHRDLKPENVWLTEDRSAKLGDFGIALSLGRTRLTMPGGVTGTALYMAPEQVSGDDVDARSDLYAFGVLLYELVAGRPPFVGDDPNTIMYQHVNAEPESPLEHNSTVPPALERLIMKLLAKDKAERLASAEEVLAELEQAATELAGGQHAPAAVRTTGTDPIEQEIRFCTSADGTRIAYATYGNDAARALVHVDSFDHAQELSWKHPMAQALYTGLALDRRLVTFDRRGVGSSERDVDDLAVPKQVDDVAAVVDQLGLESFDLMGSNTGGTLAAAYAAEHPERVGRLVLRFPLMRTSDSPLVGFQHMAQSIRANWSLARRSWAAISYPNGPTELQRWFSNMLRDSLTPEVAARSCEVVADFDGRAILPTVQAPTLVLAMSGPQDVEIAAVRAVASLIPHARLVTLEGDLGTLSGEPSQWLAAVRNFLDEAEAESEAKA